MDIRVTRARKVFTDGKHNAFTGIAAAHSMVFVTFRSGGTHTTMDGTIKVIASRDMECWNLVAEARRSGVDLRDPKLVAFGQTLMVLCGERRADGPPQSLVFRSKDGVTFDEPTPVGGIPNGRWLWHAQPCGDTLYGTAYGSSNGEDAVALYGSGDGLDWEWIADFPVPGNEVYLDFDRQGVLWCLVRDDHHGYVPTLCTAEPPYSCFRSVMRLPMRLQGPMLKRLDRGCVIVCRQWDQPNDTLGRRNLRTDLFWLEDGQDIRRVRSLPSGGDTSYAGWLDTGTGRALLSYYSSHEHKMDEPHANDAAFARDNAHAEHSTPADIFLADVSHA